MDKLTPEQFRKKIAGYIDTTKLNKSDMVNIRDEVVRFSGILAKLFNLDNQLEKWTKIGNALESAAFKSNYDIELFINECLNTVKAEYGHSASTEEVLQIITTWTSRDDVWQKQLIDYAKNKTFIILSEARSRYKEVKEGKKEL